MDLMENENTEKRKTLGRCSSQMKTMVIVFCQQRHLLRINRLAEEDQALTWPASLRISSFNSVQMATECMLDALKT